jgi:MFS family permease
MQESPLFARIKSEGKVSANPLKESFTHRSNLKMVLLALFGAVMGQGVVWYTGQFYAQTFLENNCKVDFEQTRTILIWAIVFATPFFVWFGYLSDRIGRKWIMMIGLLLAAITYRPIYRQMLTVTDIGQSALVPERTSVANTLTPVKEKNFSIRTTVTDRLYDNGIIERENRKDTVYRDATAGRGTKSVAAGKKSKILPQEIYWQLVILLFIQILYVTMVYGPIAAFLVELFPTRIRYTSMSLPYHIGNGVFGGLTPFIALLLGTMYAADPLVGLWYPIGVALVCLVIGTLYISNKIDPDVND